MWARFGFGILQQRLASTKRKVILLVDVPNLGVRAKQVDVAKGYARNFLIPKGMAVISTPENERNFDVLVNKETAEDIVLKAEAEAVKRRFKGFKMEFKRHCPKDDIPQTPLTAPHIAKKMKEWYRIRVNPESIHVPDGAITHV